MAAFFVQLACLKADFNIFVTRKYFISFFMWTDVFYKLNFVYYLFIRIIY
jgi:hypothetical protein